MGEDYRNRATWGKRLDRNCGEIPSPTEVDCPSPAAPAALQMRAEMEAQLQKEMRAKSGGVSLTEEQVRRGSHDMPFWRHLCRIGYFNKCSL